MNSPYTKADILQMLKTNDFAVERALLVLFSRQTTSEQNAESTNQHNGVGFTAFDAPIFSSFAKHILANKYNMPNGRRLSTKQFEICRKANQKGAMKIGKYAEQLARVANETAAATTRRAA